MNEEKDLIFIKNNEDDLDKFIHIMPRYEDGRSYIQIHIGSSQDGFVFNKDVNHFQILNLIERLVHLSKQLEKDKDERNGH